MSWDTLGISAELKKEMLVEKTLLNKPWDSFIRDCFEAWKEKRK